MSFRVGGEVDSSGDTYAGFDCLFLEAFYEGIGLYGSCFFGYLERFGGIAGYKVACFGEEDCLINSDGGNTFAPAEAARRIT